MAPFKRRDFIHINHSFATESPHPKTVSQYTADLMRSHCEFIPNLPHTYVCGGGVGVWLNINETIAVAVKPLFRILLRTLNPCARALPFKPPFRNAIKALEKLLRKAFRRDAPETDWFTIKHINFAVLWREAGKKDGTKRRTMRQQIHCAIRL